MRRVRERVLAKGFTVQQMEACLDEYASLDVSYGHCPSASSYLLTLCCRSGKQQPRAPGWYSLRLGMMMRIWVMKRSDRALHTHLQAYGEYLPRFQGPVIDGDWSGVDNVLHPQNVSCITDDYLLAFAPSCSQRTSRSCAPFDLLDNPSTSEQKGSRNVGPRCKGDVTAKLSIDIV